MKYTEEQANKLSEEFEALKERITEAGRKAYKEKYPDQKHWGIGELQYFTAEKGKVTATFEVSCCSSTDWETLTFPFDYINSDDIVLACG